jgi:hypothetical protein
MSLNARAIRQSEQMKAENVLRVSAQELAKLNSLASDLQAVLGNLVGTAEGLDSEAVKSLQSLDYIQQSLTALSSVISDAADHAAPNWAFQVLESVEDVTLAELRHRFITQAPQKPHSVSDGHCDYF